MIHACIEDNQGLKDLYNQGFGGKKKLVQLAQWQSPTLDELYDIMSLPHVRATLPPNPNKSTNQA
jgi:type II secretory pathway predicted ATPase ExeA